MSNGLIRTLKVRQDGHWKSSHTSSLTGASGGPRLRPSASESSAAVKLPAFFGPLLTTQIAATSAPATSVPPSTSRKEDRAPACQTPPGACGRREVMKSLAEKY